MNLDEWKQCLCGLGDEQAKDFGMRLYQQIYLNKGGMGLHQTHDGVLLQFWENQFDHAFYTSSDPARHRDWKDKLDKKRIERVWWILPTVQARVANWCCWQVASPSGRKYPPNRLYVAEDFNYVVWLRPKGAKSGPGWVFESAYPAHPEDIKRYKRGGSRVS